MTFNLVSTARPAIGRLILAHGAGAGIQSPFMETMTSLLMLRRISVTRFEFSYMAGRRTGSTRRPPPKAEKLVPEYLEMVGADRGPSEAAVPLFIGGKSLGGRVASMTADTLFDERRTSGLVCLGYPFHPPGQPDSLRTSHLETMRCPTLIIQGERDPFGSRDDVAKLRLSPAIRTVWLGDSDHDFKPRRASGRTSHGNLAAVADAVAAFMADVSALR